MKLEIPKIVAVRYCPFCGSVPRLHLEFIGGNVNRDEYVIGCNDYTKECLWPITSDPDLVKAVEKWNRRTRTPGYYRLNVPAKDIGMV